MSDLQLQCPQCGKSLKIDPKHAGRRGKCSGCGNRMIIPAAASSRSTEQTARVVLSERIVSEADMQSEFGTPRVLSPIERRTVVILGIAMLFVSLVTLLGALASLLIPLIQLIGELSG